MESLVREHLVPPTQFPGITIGIVGATGAVGQEMITCLASRGWLDAPTSAKIVLFAGKSAGTTVTVAGVEHTVQAFSLEAAKVCDVVLLAADADFAAKNAPALMEHAVVIDNSSHFRYKEEVPLVVPEINGLTAMSKDTKLVANPNCTTAIALMALAPLHEKYGLARVIVSSYQSTSGAGQAGMEALKAETKASVEKDFELSEKPVKDSPFPKPIAFNLLPHIDKFEPNGYTKEEMKVTWETRKILNLPNLPLSCTAVRVPILRAHSEAISIETNVACDPEEAKRILAKAVGVQLCDDPAALEYPTPMKASGKEDVLVGRVRKSLVFGDKGLDLFVSGDQLLRGAALNAVLIAEMVLQLRARAQGGGAKRVKTG